MRVASEGLAGRLVVARGEGGSSFVGRSMASPVSLHRALDRAIGEQPIAWKRLAAADRTLARAIHRDSVAAAPVAGGLPVGVIANGPHALPGGADVASRMADGTAGASAFLGGPRVPRSVSREVAEIGRRAEVAGLPVSGAGSLAGVARSVATDVARVAAEEAVVERVQRESTAMAERSAMSSAMSVVQRMPDGSISTTGSAGGGSVQPQTSTTAHADAPSGERTEDVLRSLAASDEFEGRLIELIEERLLAEIERRGGRYGGWFA